MTSSAYDFNNFYLALQQSALYYSNLALRQQQIGYDVPLPINRIGIPNPYTNYNQIQPNQQRSSKVKTKVIKASPSSAFTTPTRPPPVVISTEESYALEVDVGQGQETIITNSLNRSQRKVNFAQPLFTVKIKSPTPLHAQNNLYRKGVGETLGIWGDCSGRNIVEVESSAEENESLTPTSASASDVNVKPSLDRMLQNDEGSSKKRKKRKKSKKRRLEPEYGGGDIPSYSEGWDEDYPSAYDYEFISEIRLCTKEDLERTINAEADKERERLKEAASMKEERKHELETLYGIIGGGRILRMEDKVEETFLEELCRTK